MSPLRLVLIARRFWPLVGETERGVARLAAELVARQCRVSVLSVRWNPRWPSELIYCGAAVRRLLPAPRTLWTTVEYLRTIARWLRQHREEFDLVYVSGLREEAYAAVRTLRGQRPVVLRAEQSGRDGDCLWQLDAPCGRRLKRQCLRADAFVGPTPAVCRELVAAGYRRDRTYGLSDGVPILPLRTWERQEAARESLAAADPAKRIAPWSPLALCVGPLAENQGLEELLTAWEQITRRWPQARLWLVGAGPLAAELRRQIEQRNLSSQVSLAGEFHDLEELLMAASLLVAPLPQGRGSLALLEAMAAGLPVVATDLPDHRQFTAGQGALLVPPGDVPALSGALARLLEEPDLGTELGAAARQRAVAEFSLARMAEEHLKLFESLVCPAATAPLSGMLFPRQERS